MAFNENFVVRNGLEVASGLIYADYLTNKVGIGTTTLTDTLTVSGNISGQNINISGISTVSQKLNVGLAGTVLTASATSGFVGIGTTNPQYALDVRVGSGQTAFYTNGDLIVDGNFETSNITISNASLSNLNASGIITANSGIFTTLNVSGTSILGVTSTTNLNVSGITTAGFITATNLNVSGITTVGFITATDSYVSGTSTITTAVITTLSVTNANVGGIITSTVSDLTATGITSTNNLNVSGISTFVGVGTFSNDLYIGGKVQVASGSTSVFNGDVQFNTYLVTIGNSSSDEVILNSVITSDLIPRLDNNYDIGSSSKKWKSVNAGLGTFDNIYTSGISTLGTIQISSGIITATTGIVTYYGDGSKLQNVISGVGIATEGGTVGSGVTFLDLRGAGISTVTVSSGIATINIEGGDVTTRIDKQSFNVGVGGTDIFTLSQPYTSGYIDVYRNGIRLAFNDFTELNSTTIGLTTAASNGDVVEFQSFKQVVNTATNSNLTNLDVSGITTLGSSTGVGTVTVGSGLTALLVEGDARVTGILTIGTASITLDGSTNKITVGTGVTIYGNSGIVSATAFYGDGSQLSNIVSVNYWDSTSAGINTTLNVGIGTTNPQGTLQVGTGVTIYGNSGIVSATAFYGDGSQLQGVVSGIELQQAGSSVGTSLTAINFASGATLTTGSSGISTITIAAGIGTEASTGGLVTLDLTAQDHKVTATGITTITVSGGSEGDSHTVRIVNSGIATVGFSTYFLFPSGSTPVLPTASGAISLLSFTVHRVGTAGTQLLAGASLNFS